jgi:hypothetical protein
MLQPKVVREYSEFSRNQIDYCTNQNVSDGNRIGVFVAWIVSLLPTSRSFVLLHIPTGSSLLSTPGCLMNQPDQRVGVADTQR